MVSLALLTLLVAFTPVHLSSAATQLIANVSGDPQSSSDAHAAVSGSHVYVVWTSSKPSGSDILFRSSVDNGYTWGPVANLSADSGKSFNPRIKAVGDNVYVTWADNSIGKDEVMLKVSRDFGQTWTAPLDLSNTPAPSRHERITGSGQNLYVAWVENVGKNNEVMFTTSKDAGTTWTKPQDLSDSVNDSENIRLLNSGNSVFVVWMDDSPGSFQIFTRSSIDGGTNWSPAVNLSMDSGNAVAPDLGVQANGTSVRVYITWQDDSSGVNEVLFKSSPDSGATWSQPIDLSNSPGSSVNPVIQTQTVGTLFKVYVSWTDTSTSSKNALFAVSSNGGSTFGTPVSLGSDSIASAGTRLLAQPHSVLVAWSDSTPGNRDVFLATSLNFGATFAPSVNLSSDPGSSTQMSFSDNDNGQGPTFVVWTDSTTGQGDIYVQLIPVLADSINPMHVPVHFQPGRLS
jgi:BNR repeat-like domain